MKRKKVEVTRQSVSSKTVNEIERTLE